MFVSLPEIKPFALHDLRTKHMVHDKQRAISPMAVLRNNLLPRQKKVSAIESLSRPILKHNLLLRQNTVSPH